MRLDDISEGVAGPKNCWPGYRKVGTKPGTGKNAGKRVNDCEKIKEGLSDEVHPADVGEYDREGDMAINQLKTINDAATELRSILDAEDNLPEWVQAKITKAVDYIDTARDYMKSKESVAEEQVDEIDRRGFLKGIGAAAVAGAAGNALAFEPGSLKHQYYLSIQKLIISNLKKMLPDLPKLQSKLQSDLVFKADVTVSGSGKIVNRKLSVKGDAKQSPNRTEIFTLNSALLAAIDEIKQLPRMSTSNMPSNFTFMFNFKPAAGVKKEDVAESYGSGEFEVDGYTYFTEIEKEEDNQKIFHMLKTPDGKTVSVDFTPYRHMSQDDVKLYIKLGMPKRQGPGPLNSEELRSMAQSKGVAEAYDPWDEGDMWYKFDSASGTLRQRSWKHAQEREAQAAGWSQSHEQALKQVGIIRSKFNPKKFVRKQGDKWVEVFPYGKP
jgi:hypothetical protein